MHSRLPAAGFLFDGRAFRGTFSALTGGEIVNLVDLEQYLYAVVPHEMPSSWASAGVASASDLRAHVRAAAQQSPSRLRPVPSEDDQVYPGVTGESPAGRLAVDATAGQVLRYSNGFASIAYSSCCGGHTEASSDAWGGRLLPYFGGVRLPYCTLSPNYRWTAGIPLDSVARVLPMQLAPIGNLKTFGSPTSTAAVARAGSN